MYPRGSSDLSLAVSIVILSLLFQQCIIHAQPVTKDENEYQEYREAPVSNDFIQIVMFGYRSHSLF